MTCCTPSCQKWTVLGLAIFLLVFGVVITVLWTTIFHSILLSELQLSSTGTAEYKMWKKTPLPMFIEFHLFNWTNHEEVTKSKWTIKPKFEDCGPYVYSEMHTRRQVQFNNNRTVTYKTERVWHFRQDMSKGHLSDMITTLNPIAATVGYFVRNKNPIVQIGLNFFLEEKRVPLAVTHNVSTWLFDGYDDDMLDLLHKLNSTSINVPFDKFGWFYSRNGSADYDGTFTMYDGSDDVRKLGRFTLWNGQNHTDDFPGECGEVRGTSGELFYPVKDDETASVFAPDTCSTITLVRNGTMERYGVSGPRFVGTDKVFDNGTKYPDMACFSPGDAMPSGIRNVSHCKFGAPAFVSYPHFYLADPWYRESIDGMAPDPSKHEFFMSIEPETGIPLEVSAGVQLNLMIEPVKHIKLLEQVKLKVLPVLWFRQYAKLDENLASLAKMMLVLPAVGHYTGFGIIGVGSLLLFIWGVIVYRKGWIGGEGETPLLSQETL